MSTVEKVEVKDQTTGLRDILVLLFILVGLLLLLVYFYKKLNRDTGGQYTVQRLVYKEGGVRDRLRGGVRVLEASLGRRLWPLGEEEEEGGEEEEDDRDRGRDVEGGESEGEEENEESEGEEEEGDSSDDYSSVDPKERVKPKGEMRVRVSELEEEEKREEEKKGDAREDGEVKVEVEVEGGGGGGGGGGLLIDLKQFSGSAIWFEDQINDVTAL